MMRRVDLSADVTNDLRQALRALPVQAGGLEELLASLLRLAGHLPVELISALLGLRAALDAPGTLLVTGVPIDADLPPTPSGDGGGLSTSGPVSRRALLLLAVLLGEPLAYQGEKDGALVQDVFPIATFERAPSNDGSAVELGFHTELTFSRSSPEQPLHVTCPDFLLLLALRCPPDRAATTITVDARAMCSRLIDGHLAVLRDAQFQLRAPHSFTRDGQPRPWSAPVPLVRGSSEAPSVAFDLACGVRALSSEAAAALDALRNVCADPAIQNRVQLGSGDLLVVDNNRCAHARAPFLAHYDGQDRWLRRAYVRRSIWQFRSALDPSTRVLA
jgi:L-asparagine oxygenase